MNSVCLVPCDYFIESSAKTRKRRQIGTQGQTTSPRPTARRRQNLDSDSTFDPEPKFLPSVSLPPPIDTSVVSSLSIWRGPVPGPAVVPKPTDAGVP